MAPQQPIVHPTEVEWEFGGKTFVQEELSIEGEIRLAQIVGSCASQLVQEGFPVQRLADVVDENDEPDIPLILDLASQALGVAPQLAIETACVMLNVYPKNEDGSRNPDYDELKAALRQPKGGLKFSQWINMVEVFAQQNDLQRLTAPFAKVIGSAIQYGLTMNGEPSSNGSATEVQAEESKPTSEPSTSSPPAATARRKKSSAASRTGS